MQQEDFREFITAMEKKIEVHEMRKHWDLVKRESIPKGMKTILSIWSFKRKRLPDGTLLKHKTRICAHGGQQKWGKIFGRRMHLW